MFAKNKNDSLPIGVIAVDSIYTPVERVNMSVQNTRVGQVTDFDKLTLDVYTNGTLDTDEAVSLASKVLFWTYITSTLSSVPGVKEDVTEIVLNIKQLEIKNNSTTDEPKVAHIDVTGDCVVTAADIQVDSDIEH